jgi:carbamoyltransferase
MFYHTAGLIKRFIDLAYEDAMYILGISCYYHDAAAALLKDGDLIAAAAEERFSRKKHDSGFPRLAIDFCLEQAGITGDDLDYVVFYEKPLTKFERILMSSLATYPLPMIMFRESMITWFNEKLWIKSELLDKLKLPTEKLLFTEHHMSHAASAFFASPFEEAAVLTIDGVGEWTTATVGQATADWGKGEQKNHIELFSETRFPHSLGLLYSAFTAYLGFEVNEGEYKVMGMAPFGKPEYLDQVYKTFDVSADGSFRMNMDYFSYHYSAFKTYNRKFVDLFGPERKKEMEFFTSLTHPNRAGQAATKENERFANIAASIQVATEQTVIKMANHAHQRTGSKNLVMAGGVALNSVANGLILDQTPFDNLYIQPEAGDAGGALGAALYAYHVILGKPRKFIMENTYYGKEYSTSEIKAWLDKENIKYEYIDDENKLLDRTVETIVGGGVVGWHQGRFEWGPRALGSRSILADPRKAEMKEIVNVKIKFREPFRPFAPVVMEERAPEYFDMGKYQGQHTPRFMLVVRPIPADKQGKIPAVTHVNGGGRLQAVREKDNPWYYGLLKRFDKATGVPVLLNTSFNLRGEPIVTTPANAFNTFKKGALELLVMDHFLVYKDK